MVKKGDEPTELTLDYRNGTGIPAWVKEAIETHLAIESEDAKSAGALGFMARALTIATMPYKDPKADVFKRVNGDFKLRIVAGYEGGLPFGIYPRLLMSWVSTEAVRRQSPIIELGDSLSSFLRDVLEVDRGGGPRGSSTRVREQMKRLFGSLITAQYTGGSESKGFVLRNIMLADELRLNEETSLWTPQEGEDAGKWRSTLKLTNNFFQECVDRPVPIDLRAYKALRGSPLAMDVYTWLTYRLSYTQRKTRPMKWESLMAQFGSSYGSVPGADPGQAGRDFKKAFIKALTLVHVVYPQAKVKIEDDGLVLLPSPTHVLPAERKPAQNDLF
jgi:hypothetical protein